MENGAMRNVTTTNTTCQHLLEQNPVHFGYLKRKEKFLSSKLWHKCYVVIHDGILYVYPGANAKKPDLTCKLFGYDRIEHPSSNSQSWVFNINPLVSSLPVLTFAAASKSEMVQWIHKLSSTLLEVHKKPNQRSKLSSVISNYQEPKDFIQESEYSDLNEPNPIFNSMKTDTDLINFDVETNSEYNDVGTDFKLSLFEYPANQDYSSDTFYQDPESFSGDTFASETPNLFDINFEGECSQASSKLPHEVEKEEDDSDSYYNAALFSGSREEASKEILSHSKDGIFLVRQDDSRQILTVLQINPLKIIKYVLESNFDSTIYIPQNVPMYFDSLPLLLYHYHHNNLPNRDIRLSFPYGLDQIH